MAREKTTIIISHLPKSFFIPESNRLLGAERLKVAVLSHEEGKYHPELTYWLALPSLLRVVLIFREAKPAAGVYAFLTSNSARLLGESPKTKITLQESMMSRSRSVDLRTQPPAAREYEEPVPAKFDSTKVINRLRLHSTLQLVPTPTPEALEELEFLVNANLPGVPSTRTTPGLPSRGRSPTQTLYSPPVLGLDTTRATGAPVSEGGPSSPTITLDCHF